MRIEWAIPCRYCEVDDNDLTMVGGNSDLFLVDDLPVEIGIYIALQLVAPADESGPDVPHSFRARVLDPNLEEIPGTQLEIPDFTIAEPAMEGWESDEVVPSWHNFLAHETGAFTIELQVDERSKAVPIVVAMSESDDDEEDEDEAS